MSGRYIKCGDFYGGDKSGTAIPGVFEGIKARLAPAAENFERNFEQKIPTDSAEIEEDDDSAEIEMRIDPTRARILIEPLREYYEDLREKLNDPKPFDAPEIDRRRGLDPTAAKYGAGDGWRFYCAHDLLRACERSLQTGDDVLIIFS